MDRTSNWLKDTLLVNDSGKLDDSSVGNKKLDDLARAFSEASALSSCSKKQNRKRCNNSSTRARAGRTTAEETPVPGRLLISLPFYHSEIRDSSK